MKILFTKIIKASNLRFATFLLFTFFSGYNALAVTITASENGDWSSPSSWDLNRVPISTDDVEIPDGVAIFVTTAPNNAATINVSGSGVLIVQSGGSLTVTGSVSQTEGTFNVNNGGSVSCSSLLLTTGTLAGSVTVAGAISGSFNVNATASISASSLALTTSTIKGSVSVTGDITFNGSVTVDGATLTSTAGNVTVNNGGNLIIKNTGTLVSSGTSKTFSVNSGGSFQLNSGCTANIKAFTTIAGATAVTLAGSMNINGGAWINGAAVSGLTGKVFNFSSLTANSNSQISFGAGGEINGPFDGTTEGVVSSSINLTSGSISSLGVASTLKVKGTFTIPSGNFAQGSSVISTYGTSTISAGSLVILNDITINSGTLNLNSTGTVVTVQGTVINNGAIVINGLYQFGAFTNSGALTNNGTLYISTSFTDNGTFNSGSPSNIEFNGSSDMTIGGSSSTSFFNFVHSGNGNLTGTGSFSVSGDYTNSGSGTGTYSAGTVTFTGTSKTIDGGSNGTTFNNVTISGSASAAEKVNLAGILSIGTGSSFDADGSANDATFTVLSTSSTATGSIASLTGATLTGNMTIQRYLSTLDKWKYLSFPFSSALTIQTLQNASFKVNGHFASGTSFTIGESFYTWDATAATPYWLGIGWGAGATSATNLSNTKGYSAYAYGPNSNYSGAYQGTLVNPSDGPNNGLNNFMTLAITGTPTIGDVTIPLTSGKDNLIPNPYPSPIDFKSIRSDRSGSVGTGFAIQTNGGVNDGSDNSTLAYFYWNGTAYVVANQAAGSAAFGGASWNGQIAMGQSFWVTAGTSSVTLHESDKYSGTAYYAGKVESLPSAANNLLRVTLTSGKQKDETVVLFAADGSDTYNDKRDFAKFVTKGNPVLNSTVQNETSSSTDFGISTIKSGSNKQLVFNFMPLMDCSTPAKTVTLNLSNVNAGSNSLTFSDLSTFTLGYKLTLIDNLLKKEVTITDNMVYSFNSTSDVSSYNAGRFQLKLQPQELVASSITVSGKKLTVASSTYIQWYKDGKAIVGATSASYEATQNGSYTVKTGYSDNCTVESAPVVLTITGLDKESAISAYPNPVNDLLTVTFPSGSVLERVALIDSKGSKSLDLNYTLVSDNSLTIDVSGYTPGIYILVVKELKGNTNTVKISKK